MKDLVFDLIHSLTPFEKAYVKKNCKKNAEGKIYLLLVFDAIAAQKEYDEQAILKRFRKESFVKHFSVTKNHLIKYILKSIKNIQHDMNVQDEMHLKIDEITQLYYKRLFAHLSDYIIKAKKFAYEYELWLSLLEVIKLELTLLNFREYDANGINKINLVLKEQKDVLEIFSNEQTYLQLSNRQKSLLRQHFYIKDEQQRLTHQDIINNTYLLNVENALSIGAKINYYFIHYYYAAINHNREEAYSACLNSINMMDTYPIYMAENRMTQLAFYHNILYATYYLGKTKEMHQYLEALKKICVTKSIETNAKSCYTDLFQIMYLRLSKQSDNTKSTINQLLKNFDTAIALYPFEFKMNIIMHCTMAAIEHNEFILADNILHKGLKTLGNTFREDMHIILKILQIIIHIQKMEYDFVNYLHKELSGFIQKSRTSTNFEKIFLSNVKEIVKAKTNSSLNTKPKINIAKLIALEQDHKDEIDKDLFPFVIAFLETTS